MLRALQPPMMLPRFMLTRLAPTLALVALGAGLFLLLAPGERAAIEAQLTGIPDSDVVAHRARQWVLGGLCLLPALAMLGYGFGNTLDRYLARLFAVAYALCFGSLFTIWLLVDLGGGLGEFVKSGHPVRTALTYYGARSPAIVVLLLPYSLLLALIYTLGKLSRDRELVAMIQSGRSMMRLLVPLILAGLWSSLLCMGFNYHWAPEAEGRRKEILDTAMGKPITAADNVLYFNPGERRLWKVGAFPKHYELGEPLRAVDVTTTRPDGGIVFRVVAGTARWRRDGGVWVFDNPALSLYPDHAAPVFEKVTGEVLQRGWPETPWQIIRPGLEAGFLGVPDLNGWIESYRRLPAEQQNRHAVAPYLTQWHYRWALPFTCLVTVLLAAPLSIHFSRRPPGSGIFLAVVLSALMMLVSSLTLSLGESAFLPPMLAAWSSNLLFALLGIYLFKRRSAGQPIYRLLFRRAAPATR